MKGRECSYARSKRGGPRVPRRKSPNKQLQIVNETKTDRSWNDPQCQQVPSFIFPGAGLRHLDLSQDSEYIFDSIFSAFPSERQGSASDASPTLQSESTSPVVRMYGNDSDILDAYYVFVHPFFPILPPPVTFPAVDRPLMRARNPSDSPSANIESSNFEPSSPISLAISSILTLIPHPDDRNFTTPESILLRREHAQSFAQSTMESIEIESELLDSSTSPSRALSGSPSQFYRPSFHPKMPLELESILALLVLSIYEYAQRGNITKMRSRAGQALISAMNIGLHSRGSEDDEFAEARRRAWWMTVSDLVLLLAFGSIVSNTPPTILIYDPKFTTRYPTFTSDKDAWSDFLQAQQMIVAATQFIIDLNVALEKRGNLSYVYARMQELESIIEPLIAQADTWSFDTQTSNSVDSSESIVVASLKDIARIKLNSARIKLHRYCAFSDIPIFMEKHCDLKSMTEDNITQGIQQDRTRRSSSCSCGSLFNPSSNTANITLLSPPSSSSSSSSTSSLSSLSTLPSPTTSSLNPNSINSGPNVPNDIHRSVHNLPFTKHYSTKICLKSALNIAHSFQRLPHPNPTDSLNYNASDIQPPRTMPSAIRSTDIFNSKNEALVGNLLGQLRNGLGMVIEALRNYSIAFEALDGMRNQIEKALNAALPQPTF
ncbi:MAG: hypothetical protein M1827_002178 [Pycnora praestabilis]|nr:MAG: hypothetical protein M1827_002178 [Pycnora praestabilis]